MNAENLTNNRLNLHPHISFMARITMLLGILSLVSVFLALTAVFLVMTAGIYTYLPAGREYLYLLFWLLWLPLPIVTIICGTYARKAATVRGKYDLALIGLMLGYVSLAIISAIIFAEITLFFRASGCTPAVPCE